MTFCKLPLLCALALTLLVSPTLARSDGPPAPPAQTKVQPPAAPIPVRWLPEWLKTPLSRAIADAKDPRTRD